MNIKYTIEIGWLVCGQQFFSHVGTEPPLPGYLPVLWGA